MHRLSDSWLPLALLILIPVLILYGWANATFIYIGHEPSAWCVICGADTLYVEAEGGIAYAECDSIADWWRADEWVGEIECRLERGEQ